MGRFRSYGNARGARTYLSRREEYALSDDEKHEAYKRRSSAIQAPVKPMAIPKLVPVQPFWAPTVDYDAMLAASEPAPVYKPTAAPTPAPAMGPARAPMQATPMTAPQTLDLFAESEEDDEEEGASEAPGM